MTPPALLRYASDVTPEWVTEVLGGLDDSLSMDESSSLGSGGYVPNF